MSPTIDNIHNTLTGSDKLHCNVHLKQRNMPSAFGIIEEVCQFCSMCGYI